MTPPARRVTAGAGGFAAAVGLAPLGVAAAAAASVVAVAAAWFAGGRRRLPVALLVGVLCVAGAARGVSAAVIASGPHSVAGHVGLGPVVLRGTVADAGVPGRDDTVSVRVTELAAGRSAWAVAGIVVVEPRTPVILLPGDEVEVQAPSLRPPVRRPGALSAAALDRLGVSAIAPAAAVTLLAPGGPSIARLAEVVRRALTAVVARALPEPQATLLLGIAFGVHGRLPASVRSTLQDAGLIHLVAVSGLKVVLLVGLLSSLAQALAWRRRRRVVVTLGVLAAYVVLSGAGAAATRASLTAACGLLLGRDGRRADAAVLLALCAAAMLALDPALATDVGFQLSFLGTLGILVLATPLALAVPGPRLLAEPLAVTVAATLATAPVTAGTFGVVSLIGPVANAVTLPLLPLVIVTGGGGAIAGTLSSALAWAPLQVAALGTQAVLAAARGFAALPFAAVSVGLWPAQWTAVQIAAGAAGALAWVLRHRLLPTLRRAPAVVVAVAVALGAGTVTAAAAAAVTPGSLRVTVLDVGAGTAVLVRPPAGGAVLVDGGSDGTALLSALGRVLSPLDRHLDAVVLTATDHATAAAIPALLGRYDVGALVVSEPLPPALETVAGRLAGAGARVLVAGGAPWQLGGVGLRCLPSGPDPAAPCALLLGAERSWALVTGGLAQAAQDDLAAVHGRRLRCDLLVGPTTTAPSAALLAVAAPSALAVPASRTPAGLAALGIDVAVTGRDGDLTYTASASGGFDSDSGAA